MGASALGIAGQSDIDIYICCPTEDFGKYVPKLKQVFGENKYGISIIKWELAREGFHVELYLTDPTMQSMQEHIKVFDILKGDQNLRKEYESIKLSADGFSLRRYRELKYEFFNRILGEN